MSNVVYILGAGFSAPLGLPVMSDFLFRAKDLYFRDPATHAFFSDVFDRINEMATIKNFYGSDLYNVEEILSILEMSQSIDERNDQADFVRFICDVIASLTPPIEAADCPPGNWHEFLAGDGLWNLYAPFIAALVRLEVNDQHYNQYNMPSNIRFQAKQFKSEVIYSIVTLNYDLVIEQFVEHLQSRWNFDVGVGASEVPRGAIEIAKLHGSVSSGNIVAPTWNKSLRAQILPEWRRAHALLANANHIRVIGYSLPAADAYVRYLFKSSCRQSKNLKSFDVMCLDPEGSVEARYRDFVAFPRFGFKNCTTEEYLAMVKRHAKDRRNERSARYDALERAHAAFMLARR